MKEIQLNVTTTFLCGDLAHNIFDEITRETSSSHGYRKQLLCSYKILSWDSVGPLLL